MSDTFERGYQAGYRAALGAAAAECRTRATALDHGGHEYTRSHDLAVCAVAITGLRVPSIAIPLAGTSVDPVQWLRNNYDAYPNIASLCDAMRAAMNGSPTQ